MPLNVFYTMVQKSQKWPKTQVEGSCLKKSEATFVAMSMLNKCAKFHGDSPSGKKVKFNLARAIELLEMADFVYNFV